MKLTLTLFRFSVQSVDGGRRQEEMDEHGTALGGQPQQQHRFEAKSSMLLIIMLYEPDLVGLGSFFSDFLCCPLSWSSLTLNSLHGHQGALINMFSSTTWRSSMYLSLQSIMYLFSVFSLCSKASFFYFIRKNLLKLMRERTLQQLFWIVVDSGLIF